MVSTLRKTDLNLLLIFDSLYRHGSVTEAANEMALSPSALSHALNRLRASLDDPLFVRTGGRMVPTSKAESIAANVSAALNSLSTCLHEPEHFEPEKSRETFTFAATDYTAAVILPGLIARVNSLAPGITIKLIYSRDFNADEDLLSGKVDFALGFEEEQKNPRRGIESITCFTDDYVVAVRRGHPEIYDSLTHERYLNAGHVVVRPWLESRGAIDRYLESQQVRRRIVVELPSLMIAPLIVSNTDLVITLPKRGISSVFDMKNLVVFTPPFPTPQYILKAYYSPQLSNSPGHLWMKEQILQVCEPQNPITSMNAADQTPDPDR
ncbi:MULTISPECIES: LysR family transcriptional regulator [Citrobacter]|uniref:LysR family transcriptional regulator n=1 Tax=Citrobacter TaxID=544 RepID=UPI0010C9D5DD|nr:MULTISPECIES: LysR family transcriptional regulator [Citrobacter]MBJ8883839.1 LysR family transcriptional regulator [Citrobacter sp. FDAARGOS_156]MBJ9110991.1 LysR family transcriptional regulator [Citrobacter sp. FDAARGOS_156]MBJ9204475.1 LysR family transcriptional regulator [Citrobacter sp. FDAARGOS_156]MBK6259799.1 LysR family transcriptional regulator [Citrobacter youngae]TKU15367.1 LysR family transcriptional regulator [Citrobacter sp. wls827]